MAMKAALGMALCLCVVLMVAADDETYQEVLTTAGSNVVFGADNTYVIWSRESGIGYLFNFYFGLGFPGDAVRTDTAITMGAYGDASRIYACNGEGKLELVAVSSSGTPENALIRIRFNSTDNNYRLQITEASPPVYVQFVLLSQGGILCTAGLPGTPIHFASTSSSSSSNRAGTLVYELPVPKMQPLHQVVEG